MIGKLSHTVQTPHETTGSGGIYCELRKHPTIEGEESLTLWDLELSPNSMANAEGGVFLHNMAAPDAREALDDLLATIATFRAQLGE